MSKFTVDIYGSGGRAVRAVYGNTDINGDALNTDPVVSAALATWYENGSIDGDTVEVTISSKAVLQPSDAGYFTLSNKKKTKDRAKAVADKRASVK